MSGAELRSKILQALSARIKDPKVLEQLRQKLEDGKISPGGVGDRLIIRVQRKDESKEPSP